MKLPLITRTDQSNTKNIFSSFPKNIDDDVIFDGEPIDPVLKVENWRLESEVHHTVLLSSDVTTTRNLVGSQENLVRDELRRISWAAVLEGSDRLVLCHIDGENLTKSVLHSDSVWRSHISLDKFTGEVHSAVVTHRSGVPSEIFFNEHKLDTQSTKPDFPFLSISQMPIGHVQREPARFSILTYKCRDNGTSYIRLIKSGVAGKENALTNIRTVGGPSVATSGDNVLVVIYEKTENSVTPMYSLSKDGGNTFDEFKRIEIPYSNYSAIPFVDSPTTDHSGSFHIPIGIETNNKTYAINVVVDEAFVEAIVANESTQHDHVGIKRFPKLPNCVQSILGNSSDFTDVLRHRFGDGRTDGLGIISVLLNDGMLFTSNSQSGGISFPEKSLLNHEMPIVRAFKATECYTRGRNPNTVSMDYMYVEATENRMPASRDLHLETWDMPLPYPSVKATTNEDIVTVKIMKDANFVPGKTTFLFDNLNLGILDIDHHGTREVQLTLSNPAASGDKLTIEVNSLFYHFQAEVIIE